MIVTRSSLVATLKCIHEYVEGGTILREQQLRPLWNQRKGKRQKRRIGKILKLFLPDE